MNGEEKNKLKSCFYLFNHKIDSVSVFLDQSKWVIDDYLQHISEDRKDPKFKEMYAFNFDEEYYSRLSFLPNFLYQSIILLLFSLFIETLKKVLIILGASNEEVGLCYKKGCEYLKLLEKFKELGFELNLSKNDEDFLDLMSKLRNEIIHKSYGEDNVSKLKLLTLEECKLYVTCYKKILESLEKTLLEKDNSFLN